MTIHSFVSLFMNYINNSALCLLYNDQIYIIPLQACDKSMFPRTGNNVCQSTALIWVLHKRIKHPQKNTIILQK